MTTELALMQTRLQQLEQANTDMQTRIAQADERFVQVEGRLALSQRRLRIQASLAFVAFLVAVFALPANRQATAKMSSVTLAQLNTRLKVVEAKTQFQSADATTKTTTFSACNVVVRNGLGATNGNPTDPTKKTSAVNGLGNFIVGYNALGNSSGDVRTGSHNLIVGDRNSYSSYGGVVFGSDNTSSGVYAVVSGGDTNTASNDYCSVSGGVNNIASGDCSSISGGIGNTASGDYSSVSGGFGNTASADFGWSGGTYHSP